ncbi:unnamed protein product, partial [Brassica rapa subsp. trilocularis]
SNGDNRDERIDDYHSDLDGDEHEDGFENLFDPEETGVENHFNEEDDDEARSVEYWSTKLSSSGMSNDEVKSVIESWRCKVLKE